MAVANCGPPWAVARQNPDGEQGGRSASPIAKQGTEFTVDVGLKFGMTLPKQIAIERRFLRPTTIIIQHDLARL